LFVAFSPFLDFDEASILTRVVVGFLLLPLSKRVKIVVVVVFSSSRRATKGVREAPLFSPPPPPRAAVAVVPPAAAPIKVARMMRDDYNARRTNK